MITNRAISILRLALLGACFAIREPVAFAQNLVEDGDMELLDTGSSPTNWFQLGYSSFPSVRPIIEEDAEGNRFLALRSTNGVGYVSWCREFPLDPSIKEVELSCVIAGELIEQEPEAVHSLVGPVLEFRYSNKPPDYLDGPNKSKSAPNRWTPVTLTMQVPSNATHARVRLQILSARGWVAIDNVQLYFKE